MAQVQLHDHCHSTVHIRVVRMASPWTDPPAGDVNDGVTVELRDRSSTVQPGCRVSISAKRSRRDACSSGISAMLPEYTRSPADQGPAHERGAARDEVMHAAQDTRQCSCPSPATRTLRCSRRGRAVPGLHWHGRHDRCEAAAAARRHGRRLLLPARTAIRFGTLLPRCNAADLEQLKSHRSTRGRQEPDKAAWPRGSL